MAKNYPVSYRNNVGIYPERALQIPGPTSPPPSVRPELIRAVNDNLSREARRAVARQVLKRSALAVVPRLLPGLGLALTAYEIWRLMNPKMGTGYAVSPLAGGWVAYGTGCTPPNRPTFSGNGYGHYSNNPAPPAIALCQTNQSGLLSYGQIPAASRWKFYGQQHWPFGPGILPRYDIIQWYNRPGATDPRSLPAAMPIHRPITNITLAPDLLPIKQPMELPEPVPFIGGQVDPRKPNGPGRETGYDTGPSPTQGVGPGLAPRAPPKGPNVTEKKVKTTNRIFQLVQTGFHGYTEAVDAIDAVYDALPKQYRPKATFKDGKWYSVTPTQKLEALVRNLDKVDGGEALLNLLKNHFTDEIIGRALGGAQTEATTRGITQGPSMGSPGYFR